MALERQEAPLLIQEGWRASAGVVWADAASRTGRACPTPVDDRCDHEGAASRPPTSPNGGVNPPLHNPGYRVTYLPVDREGLLNLADLEAAITDETAVVSLMWANNETGVLFPVERIAEICRSRGVLYHCDAVQAAGKVEIDVRKIPADYLSLTGHKFHAPKGIGALYVRRKSPVSPWVYGGHQERNRRGGTESVPLIVKCRMGKPVAVELSRSIDRQRGEAYVLRQPFLQAICSVPHEYQRWSVHTVLGR